MLFLIFKSRFENLKFLYVTFQGCIFPCTAFAESLGTIPLTEALNLIEGLYKHPLLLFCLQGQHSLNPHPSQSLSIFTCLSWGFIASVERMSVVQHWVCFDSILRMWLEFGTNIKDINRASTVPRTWFVQSHCVSSLGFAVWITFTKHCNLPDSDQECLCLLKHKADLLRFIFSRMK